MSPSHKDGHGSQNRLVRNRSIFLGVVAGVVRNSLTDPGPARGHLLTSLWIELKRHGSARIRNIELSRIRGIDRVQVEGPVWRHSPLVVAALSTLLECETVFELGPDSGGTAWIVAHNLPRATIFQLDVELPPKDRDEPGAANRVYQLSRGERAHRSEMTPEASRITHLFGDSATFDFLPYSGAADLVYIEGSRRQAQLRSDTAAAFGLLSELGTIVWDGYSGDPGVYAYLNDLAPTLDRPVFHVLGTRLALYSRWDIVIPDD
jgi:hypothetical protein